MLLFIASFFASFFATLGIVRSARLHLHLSADHDLDGVQKFHAMAVPRIGGLGVLGGVLLGGFVVQIQQPGFERLLWLLLACAVPALGAGILEDFTKRVSARYRLAATAVSASLAIWLLDAALVRTALPGIDTVMTWAPFAVMLTLLCVAGVANAVNIIDGFNGLASMCVLMMLLGIAYVAFQVDDLFVAQSSLVFAGAVLGFFVWNYPAGLVFLGDGGAYFLGFLLAELSVLLLHRNTSVSPIFPLLLCAYPIFETIFTMYRRRVLRGVAAALPDGIHLHTLIHRRLIRANLEIASTDRRKTIRNSMTSPYLWMLCLLSIIPSVLWWDNTAVLEIFLVAFIVSYVFIYWRIVRFRTPRWLGVRR